MNFKYTLIMLYVNFLEVYFRYASTVPQKNTLSIPYKNSHGLFLEFTCLNGPLYAQSSIVWMLQSHTGDLLGEVP